jgi:hypothetical protein
VYSEGSGPDAGRVGVAIQVRRKEGGKERASERRRLSWSFSFLRRISGAPSQQLLEDIPPELRIDFGRRVVPLLLLFCVALGGLLDGKEASGRARGRVVGDGACAESAYAGLRRPGSIGSFLSRQLAEERDWDYFCGVS